MVRTGVLPKRRGLGLHNAAPDAGGAKGNAAAASQVASIRSLFPGVVLSFDSGAEVIGLTPARNDPADAVGRPGP